MSAVQKLNRDNRFSPGLPRVKDGARHLRRKAEKLARVKPKSEEQTVIISDDQACHKSI